MSGGGGDDPSVAWLTVTHAPSGTGEQPPAEPAPAVPAEDRLVDEGVIARGGMSSIRRVRDGHMRRRVAMKVLDHKATSPRARLNFLREAQILAQLDHPNVPAVYD